MLVKDVMTFGAEEIGPAESILAAARKMREMGVGALVVREEGRVLGLITDRDIVVRSTAEGAAPGEMEVQRAMTPQVLDCHEYEELEDAVTRMERGAVRRLLVVNDDRDPIGMLSVDDIALASPALAGEIVEHVRAPERPIQRGAWSWWETPEP